jgi:hypothetical protein
MKDLIFGSNDIKERVLAEIESFVQKKLKNRTSKR